MDMIFWQSRAPILQIPAVQMLLLPVDFFFFFNLILGCLFDSVKWCSNSHPADTNKPSFVSSMGRVNSALDFLLLFIVHIAVIEYKSAKDSSTRTELQNNWLKAL